MYLPVYWRGCQYNGKLYGLVSTPASIALLYNKQVFREAGLDPEHPPRTLAELDRTAQAIDQRDAHGRLNRAGYVPLQSWYVPFTCYWFGSDIFDPATQTFLLTSPKFVQAYEWMGSYSKRLGRQSIQDFLSGHPLSNFDSPQNPFLIGALAMQQQGPWMANYIMNLKPSMSQVLVPKAQEVTLGNRKDNYAWGVAPFPSAVDGLNDVSFCSFDVLIIPRGARHRKEAFEFIAYVNRQDVSEKLNTMHCKNTQLRQVSAGFFANHPNPYIDVFQRLAASANARGVPPVPIWPEVNKELQDAAQAVALEGADAKTVLSAAQQRLQARFDDFRRIQQQRERM
jgi:multiple sugar transport system substrate-binding protein